MNWIRNYLAASMLLAAITLAVVLFATGKLRWSASAVPSSVESKSAESGEAAEKKVKQGKVVLDDDDFKASGIEVAEIRKATLGETLQAPGEVQPIQTNLAQVTPPIAGIVRSIEKLAGAPVSTGGVLCTIESGELGSNRAELEAALAERDITQRNYERLKQLYEKGLRSQTELWSSEADYNKARLRVQAASARLRALGLDSNSAKDPSVLSNRYELRSPLTGLVLQQQLTIGQNVEQKDVLFIVANLSTVWVNAAVHESDLANVRKGTSAAVQAQGQNGPTTIDGRVDYISQQVDQQTRTVPVRITVKNRFEGSASQGYVLRPGMFTTVLFTVGSKTNLLAVPLNAVQELNGQDVVFVQISDDGGTEDKNAESKDQREKHEPVHTFEARPVTLGANDGKLTEIVKGLSAGEKVVVRNAFLLKSELEKEKIGDVD